MLSSEEESDGPVIVRVLYKAPGWAPPGAPAWKFRRVTGGHTWHRWGNCCDVSVTCRSPRGNKAHRFLFSIFCDRPSKLCLPFFSSSSVALSTRLLAPRRPVQRRVPSEAESRALHSLQGETRLVWVRHAPEHRSRSCKGTLPDFWPLSPPSRKKNKKNPHKQLKQKRPHLCHLGSRCRANTACWRPSWAASKTSCGGRSTPSSSTSRSVRRTSKSYGEASRRMPLASSRHQQKGIKTAMATLISSFK